MKKEKKVHRSTAVNSRRAVYKYYKIDDVKSVAIPAGRCHKCSRITDAFCDKCSKYICKNHMVVPKKEDYECYCLACGKK